MTAGTVVITGGLIAAVILLTIVTVLCFCRLQYYCCKREESDGEEEEPDFTITSPSPPHQPIPPSPPSPLSICPALEYTSSNQLLMTTEPYEPNGRALYCPCSPALPRRPVRSYSYCPSCSGYLPFYLRPPEELGGVSYRSTQGRDLDLPVDMSAFHKLNLFQSVSMREVLTHHSVSTDV
ncbi:protein FAM163B [Brachyhypopomus gauderio]|uniref:protein FAM163B n=1 Tax=Brachyhypopomus gauderio TaxID=698409 RepID=UPI004041EF63